MKIAGNADPPRPIETVRRTEARRAYRSDGASAGRRISDVVDLSGISETEMTPRVREALDQLMAEVDTLRHELENSSRRIRELEELADLDVLLPIRNRRAFVRELRRMIAFAERYDTPSTVMFIDMNDMKTINDTHGHDAGDAALLHLAQLLTQHVRATDVVGRLGGDEFGVILTQSDATLGPEKAATLIDQATKTPLVLENGASLTLKLAYGIFTVTGKIEPHEALEKADQAMYEHKIAMKGADDVR